ncbi:MAG: methyltransferase domain-containing protein [Deltaproteobacteria bacterium]|nr:MAG: methyltransferase domain-containing protein [Deltaproteobacteria bacterium]
MLRITGGQLRGCRLRAPSGRSTRPTGARVREALFQMLSVHVVPRLDGQPGDGCTVERLQPPGSFDGLRILDLFAGSGALGLEAVSRGARGCTFVDFSEAALACLRSNLLTTRTTAKCIVLRGRAPEALSRVRGCFDLVFMDPPYRYPDHETTRVLDALGELKLLAPQAVVVHEHDARCAPPAWRGTRPRLLRAWGTTAVSLYGPLASSNCSLESVES